MDNLMQNTQYSITKLVFFVQINSNIECVQEYNEPGDNIADMRA